MKLKTILFLALSALPLAAQTTQVPTVTLSGNPDNPVIENHSGKQIIAVQVAFTSTDGTVGRTQRLFTQTANELSDGGSQEFGRYGRNFKMVSAQITAVIFADGEFRGSDDHDFVKNMEQRFQSLRQTWQMAKDGNWKAVEAKANLDSFQALQADDLLGVALAQRLIADRDTHGADAAVKVNEHMGNLPASTWKGGLLDRLRIPNPLQAIADWISPTTAFAQSMFCCVGPYRSGL